MLFGLADLGRHGLGHSLPAWARCVVWSHQTGAPMIAPQWFKLRIGPYLRRERDKRNYFLLFRSPGYVAGLRRLRLLAGARRVMAGSDTGTLPARAQAGGDTIVVFKNAVVANSKTHFHEFRDHHALLHSEIRRITRPRYLPKPFAEATVAVHIRMGDFIAHVSEEDLKARLTNSRIPLSWYVESLAKVRGVLGRDVPAVVFSDGPDADLAAILSLPNVRRAPRQPSITDMLSIAQAQLLIASGSGFSTWGRFFGQVPAICFPGQSDVWAVVADPEVECGPGEALPEILVDRLRGAFLGPSPPTAAY